MMPRGLSDRLRAAGPRVLGFIGSSGRYLLWRLRGSPFGGPPSPSAWIEAYHGIPSSSVKDLPRVSIVIDAVGWSMESLRRVAESVVVQTADAWELRIIVGPDSGPSAGALGAIAGDPRVGVVTAAGSDPAGEVNAAVRGATSEHVVLIQAEGVLAPTAVASIARLSETVDLIYADHDRLDRRGHHRDPIFKPAWSPRLLLGTDYTGPLVSVRRELFEAMGGLRPGLGTARWHDAMLRLAEMPLEVAHLPDIAFHRTAHHAPPVSITAIDDALRRRGWTAHARNGAAPAVVFDPVGDPPLVKVVIPTRDQPDLLRLAAGGVLNSTDGPPRHIVVVDNGSRDAAAVAHIATLGDRDDVTVITLDEPFNFSRLINRGVEAGPDSPLLLLMNDDIAVRDPRWLLQLSGWLRDPEVVGVGPKLLLPDGRIQHAGMVIGMAGGAGHYMAHQPDSPSPGALHDRAREVGCLTAACLLVRTRDFVDVGGLDESFPLDFQDVDFCLRLAEATGGALMYDPTFPLTHVEMATRGLAGAWADETVARFTARWGERLALGDPYYSPHLSLYRHDLALREIPDDIGEREARLAARVVASQGR